VQALIASLLKNQRLLKDFVRRDLRARYVGSSMGFFWSVVYPILNLFVYMFVFSLVLNVRFTDKAPPGQVALWMLAGITVWAAYAETISRTTNTLVENANLIQKVVFPSEVLPAYLTVSSLINMCIGLPIVMLGVLWFAYLSPDAAEVNARVAAAAGAERALALGPSLVVLPVLFAAQAVFTVGLGYFLATFNLFLRDTYHLIGVFITVWMFSTPIFYPEEMVQNEGFGWMLQVNPMHWLIHNYREILVYGNWPDWVLLARFAVVGVAVLALGSTFFMKHKPRFPDLL
jgi:ABC-type polysaccharide/polyol phosphate export permease